MTREGLEGGLAGHGVRRPPDGAADRRGVTSSRGAGGIEHRDPLPDRRRDAIGRRSGQLRERVPLVGEPRREADHPRPVGGDQQRDPRPLDRAGLEHRVVETVVAALEGDPGLLLEAHQDLHGLLEPVHAFHRLRQVEAVPAVLVRVPARADPEDEPPAAHVVDRDGLLGEERRVAEGVGRDQHAEADPGRHGGQRREQRPGLEARQLGRPVGVEQMVHEPGVVEAELVRHEELVAHLRPGLARLAHEQSEAGLERHGAPRVGASSGSRRRRDGSRPEHRPSVAASPSRHPRTA